MKPATVLAALGLALALVATARAEVYPKESLIKADKKEAGGGKGTLMRSRSRT